MRILHTMLRVGDLQRSLAFYTEVLGMRLLRRKDYPEGRFTLAFVGFQDEAEGAVLELTHNWDTPRYDQGDAFGAKPVHRVLEQEHLHDVLIRISILHDDDVIIQLSVLDAGVALPIRESGAGRLHVFAAQPLSQLFGQVPG